MKRTLVLAIAMVVAAFPALSVTWDVSLWGERRAFTEHVEKLAELVSDKTDGEFTLNINYGGLAKNVENLDGIAEGKFQMAQFCAGYHGDKTPTLTALELPFLGVSGIEQARFVSTQFYKHPVVQEDMARWNAFLLMPSPLPQYNLIGKGEPPRSIAEFRRMRVRATGSVGEAIRSIGAIPVAMPATQVQQALQFGEVDAVSFAPHAHMAFGTLDKARWWTTNLDPGTLDCPVIVNLDALHSLSEEHYNALFEAVPEAMDHYIENYKAKTTVKWQQELSDRGIDRVVFSDLGRERLKYMAAEPATVNWITQMNGLGWPGKELRDFIEFLVAQKTY
ncbi:TRAP transporter substrate-binding protein DctP [Actibacterium pelagium]|uniref:TRAP-type C4-dicarboxylate transport system, substrate-binding protein n=1 Tax=Actibacterium pelagium TaxID=2029103 RepID=A0A917AET1_9RHOB|nr:TRAP transporter substrate-binding protein DctP [Actibacterium pelagium]GGE47547.1 hypothetical protein GCM10011517_14190 [Actibacterium pelagium]